MSDMSPPAGNSGGDPTTSIAAALAQLPARIRVHALAKLLGRSSREVLAAVTELGADGRSVQSSIDRELALRVAETLGVTTADPEKAEEAVAAAEPAEPPQTPQAPGFQQGPGAGFAEPVRSSRAGGERVIPPTPVFASASPLFLPPEPTATPPRPVRQQKEEPEPEPVEDETTAEEESDEGFGEDTDEGRPRRRRGRRGRGRGKGGQDEGVDEGPEDEQRPDKPEKTDKPEKADKPDRPARRVKAKEEPEAEDADEQEPGDDDPASRRRRRRRRRRGGDGEDANGNPTEDDPPNTVVHVREAREEKEKPESDGRDEVRSVRGSTRLEAKRQRRRDGREAGRRRAPILSEAEFLARREAVDRAMVIRERGDRIQIGVLEDGVLVEHFVTSAGSGSLVGNVYLGRVQNVLPSMEAAFVDIGRGRNAVLYAGEVDWDAAGLEGKARKIEQALSTGDSVLVQVTKDPVGHKGARLTTQISLPGRFLVYVPGGGATGISRKLPENERRRLKDVLKRVVPEDAGVIIRTASEGVSEEELARDVRRLQAQWQVIKDKTEGTNGTRKVGAPSLVYEEPDLLVKVVRDLFTEDFSALVVQGDIAWETVDAYVRHVAPELSDRLRKHVGNTDVFAEYRIDEQLLKALDRKVWLPSGGYLVIDRTEAMTVIDVNTGKFTGSGGNLEETVTRNNLESAEEIVRQLRLRDIGGIIVIDFIDMVLESNRDLVLRRLTECLGRDRTRHQVAEVTSLGLVQMTRKRVGTGLLEAFGTTCEHCKGRGVLVTMDTTSKPNGSNGNTEPARGNTRRSRNRSEDKPQNNKDAAKEAAALAAKEAVRDIAKATTKVVEPQAEDDTAEVAHVPEAPAVAAEVREPAEAAAEPTGHRHRHRTRSRRGESRNGASAAPEQTNGSAADSTAATTWGTREWTPETTPEDSAQADAPEDEPTAQAGSSEPTSGGSTDADRTTSGAPSWSPSGHTASGSTEPTTPVAQAATGDLGPGDESPADAPGSSDEAVTSPAGAPSIGESAPDDEHTGTPSLATPASASSSASEGWSAAGSAAAGLPEDSPSSADAAAFGRPAAAGGSSPTSEEADEDVPSVPAPSTPPRRQPRRAASRPAGPPVSVRHDG
jgi:ribonuclease E